MRGTGYYETFASIAFSLAFPLIIVAILSTASLIQKKLEKVSPKIIYFYVMAFASLIFLANGLGVLVSIIADLSVSLGTLNNEIKKAILSSFSLLIVALPSYIFHWYKIIKGLGSEEQEGLIWPYYKYMVLGISAIASLVFAGTLSHQLMGLVLGISKFDWQIFNIVLGYGIVGVAIWIYHWFVTGSNSSVETTLVENAELCS